MRAPRGLIVGGDSRQMQFDFAMWTRAMVQELIRREFGVGLSEVSVGRLLAKMGMSPAAAAVPGVPEEPRSGGTRSGGRSRPARRSPPGPPSGGATIYFADEAGIRSPL
jgi:hypothetical protein